MYQLSVNKLGNDSISSYTDRYSSTQCQRTSSTQCPTQHQQSSQKQPKRHLFSEYMLYYFTKMFLQVFILALYSVQTFTSHIQCIDNHGNRVTDQYVNAFIFGLTVNAIDFFNASFLVFYFRFKSHRELKLYGFTCRFTSQMETTTVGIEYFLRFLLGLTCGYQMFVVHSKPGRYCAYSLGALSMEARWFHCFVGLNAFKNIILLTWECKSIYARKESQGYDVISDYDSDNHVSQYSGKSSFSHKEMLHQRDIESQELRRDQLIYNVVASLSDNEDLYQKRINLPTVNHQHLTPYHGEKCLRRRQRASQSNSSSGRNYRSHQRRNLQSYQNSTESSQRYSDETAGSTASDTASYNKLKKWSKSPKKSHKSSSTDKRSQ